MLLSSATRRLLIPRTWHHAGLLHRHHRRPLLLHQGRLLMLPGERIGAWNLHRMKLRAVAVQLCAAAGVFLLERLHLLHHHHAPHGRLRPILQGYARVVQPAKQRVCALCQRRVELSVPAHHLLHLHVGHELDRIGWHTARGACACALELCARALLAEGDGAAGDDGGGAEQLATERAVEEQSHVRLQLGERLGRGGWRPRVIGGQQRLGGGAEAARVFGAVVAAVTMQAQLNRTSLAGQRQPPVERHALDHQRRVARHEHVPVSVLFARLRVGNCQVELVGLAPLIVRRNHILLVEDASLEVVEGDALAIEPERVEFIGRLETVLHAARALDACHGRASGPTAE
mmetsp:Transcript_5532/g.14124  ORF Transcript_5532/g.14124 Transcript_5532/m.14124 type:complete len:345 (+) Transcript_5532:81-1115(+)